MSNSNGSPEVNDDQEQEAVFQKIVESAFEMAGLPEIDPSELEVGTYTNAQIADKLRSNPGELFRLLAGVSELLNVDVMEKRSILSMAVDRISTSC